MSSSASTTQPLEGHTTPAELDAFEARIGYTFTRRQLLLDALTHRSYAYEFAGPGVHSNERLEFLGDAALGLIAADVLFATLPNATEGELTTLRAALVRGSALATFARRIALGPHLRLGRGEETTGGRDRDLLIARAFEALIGAIYVDGSVTAARTFLEPLLRAELERVTSQRNVKDAKSLLQEVAQARLGVTPTYRLVNQDGPSHDRIFTVEAMLGDRVVGRGDGRNKRQAEQVAAQDALTDPGWN